MIKIVTILGTKRPGNYTAKTLALVQDEIRKNPEIELIRIVYQKRFALSYKSPFVKGTF